MTRFWDVHPETAEVFDPLYLERSPPLSDDEAEAVRQLCESTTPGPLLTDEETDELGAVVATLPDGRSILSLGVEAAADEVEDAATIEANARLFCRARYYLLRLLRDRERCNQQREQLEEEVAQLRALLPHEALPEPPSQPR